MEHPSLWLYNADSVWGKDWVIIVEGPTDVWRLGDGAVCTFGTEGTEGKVRKLLAMGVKRAFVIFDPETVATSQSLRLSAILSASIPHCETVILERGDPASLTPQEAEALKAELLG
jgi:hypothetical protein